MASIIERDGRWRALIRKAGTTKCDTFATRAAAKAWAATIERQIDEMKASGVMSPGANTIADLIDRYVREQFTRKAWGRSKSADLARLRKDLGHLKASETTSRHITEYFQDRNSDGAGGVVVSAQVGYLVAVFEIARTLWHLDVPAQAIQDARKALTAAGLVAKSKRRDRRVTDTELEAIIRQMEKTPTTLPVRDVLEFCLATTMRISEVCRLQWSDLDKKDRTIVIRDRKHPQDKIGNDQVVPLLKATGFDAMAIVLRQPRKGPRIFPINGRTLGTYVTRACAALKLADLSLHDLRHEGITRLFAAKYRIEQVALVSGHRDWAMLKRYTHVRAVDLHRAPAARSRAS
jgi:integrase